MTLFKIGELAKSCGVNVDTVRYYERKNLICPVERSEAGYRAYNQDSARRLRFIRKAQNLGFTLEEIRDLLDLSDMPEKSCGDVRDKAQKKIVEIEKRIADLLTIKGALGELAGYCPGKGKPLSDCSILKHLYGEET